MDTPRPLTTRRYPALRHVAAACTVAVVLTGAGACGDDTDGASAGSGITVPTEAGDTVREQGSLSSYASIAELHDALTDAGITCNLEYEGLRDGDKELSICVIDGEQAYLTIWSSPSDVDAFAASPDATDVVARGENWTIAVGTPATAAKVADALGGTTA